MNLFIYGTLKKGFIRNECLHNCEFLGTFITTPEYDLRIAGSLPYITEGKYYIEGEVYTLNEEDIYYIDRIEGHPSLYIRKRINMLNLDNVYTYFGNNITDRQSSAEVGVYDKEIPISYERNGKGIKRYE